MKYIVLIFTVILCSCSSLSKKDCETMNWQQKGKDDGAAGTAKTAFIKYQRMCSEHHVITDQRSYEKGHAEGLKSFCTYDSGYDYGRANEEYAGVCPKEAEADFIRGYRIGKKEHELKAREERIAKREKELAIAARQDLLDGDEECDFDSDCRKSKFGNCLGGICKGSTRSCREDADCTASGRCESRSKYINNDWIRVNACTYR